MQYLILYTIGDDPQEHLFKEEARKAKEAIAMLTDKLTKSHELGSLVTFNIIDIAEWHWKADYSSRPIREYRREYEIPDIGARVTLHAVSDLMPIRGEGDEIHGEVQYIELEVGERLKEGILDMFIWELFYETNQINSQYDCTGKRFVHFVESYTKPDPFNESRNVIVKLTWGIDI